MASILSQHGPQALVTRPRDDVASVVMALGERGIRAIVEPLLEVQFHTAEAPDLRGVQAVLCTSANGVRALARLSGERRLPLFAVGDATAARARAAGFTAVVSAGGDWSDLLRLATSRLQPQNGLLLHICGCAAAGDLAGGLGAQGFTVDRLVLYEARPAAALSSETARALRAEAIDFALFFSPRTAAIFVRLATTAGVAQNCRAIAALSISAATDAALSELAWRERRIAARPNQASLLDVLDALLDERPRV